MADQLSTQARHLPKLQPGNGPFSYAPAERPHPLFGPATFALWNRAMANSGRPTHLLAPLLAAPEIAPADVSRVQLALAGITDRPIEATRSPAIWGRVAIGDEYGPVGCSML